MTPELLLRWPHVVLGLTWGGPARVPIGSRPVARKSPSQLGQPRLQSSRDSPLRFGKVASGRRFSQLDPAPPNRVFGSIHWPLPVPDRPAVRHDPVAEHPPLRFGRQPAVR